MPQIQQLTARQILDSRGRPTVEAMVTLTDGITAHSSVPSGNIVNELEALELRDQVSSEYFGLGVTRAVENVNTIIAQQLIGMDPLYQTQIDQALVDLDGTTNKSKLGGNAMLAVSQAVMKAAAKSLKLPLFIYVKEKYQLIQAYRIPTPIFNLINGGRHGSGTLDFQEFQVVPASHLGYGNALRIGVELFMALDTVLEQKGAIRTVGLEGGFSPNLAHNSDAIEIFSEALKLTQYTLSQDVFLGLDISPQSFFKAGKFTISDKAQPMNMKEFIQYLRDLHQQYRVFSFEDPLPPDAWKDWQTLTSELGETAMILGDDLITSNKTLLMKAIQEKACNALVIKPNRVGTVTETIEITNIAKQAGWHTIMSHRSGETTDDFWADVAVGIGTDYVKFGAPSRGERVAKYNRLLRIEEILVRSKESTQQNTNGEGSMNLPSTNPTNTAPPADTTVPPVATPVAPEPAPAPEPTPVPTPMPEPTPVAPVAPSPMATPAMPAPTDTPAMDPAAPAMSPQPATPMTPAPTPMPDMSAPAPAGGLSIDPMAGNTAAPAAPTGDAQLANNGLVGNPSYVATGVPAAPAVPETPAAPDMTTGSEPGIVAPDSDVQHSLDALVEMAGSPTPAAPEATVATPQPAADTTASPGGLRPPTPPTLGGTGTPAPQA